MAYNINLADNGNEYLADIPNIIVQEKQMFGGLAFMVSGKMCINIGEDILMFRCDPSITDDIAE